MKHYNLSGNEAVAKMAYALTEAAAIYPITPSSDMAEKYDEYVAGGAKNAFDTTPRVVEMQSEAGAAGTLHGIMSAGVLGTTFTASQGLLLMIPNMYKIAGELLPCVMHVSARALASHALSIFGDHSDVMSVRSTGWAMLSSCSVQEAHDMALAAHLLAIKSSYPVVHFFDGFRTSHETNKIEGIEIETVKSVITKIDLKKDIEKFRARALDPARPTQSGTAQNPDTYFQNREACNTHIDRIPENLKTIFAEIATATGRKYKSFEYIGAKDAKSVTVSMGSSTDTIAEYLDIAKGKPYGLVRVRLYRPFDAAGFVKTLPAGVKTITVLDRTKENGAVGDPLFVDVCTALAQNGRTDVRVIAGRYGLGSKEFTPSMCEAIYKNADAATPKNHFTIGINDDVTHLSLPYTELALGDKSITECKFYGLGSDGTVGANKNTANILSNECGQFAQAYFVYDSKKSGGTTTSHIRFSKSPINKPYLVTTPSFVACHNQSFLGKFEMLSGIREGGTFLLNTTYTMEELFEILPPEMKQTIASQKIKFYAINAYKIAADLGLKGRINTIMQSAFFYLTSIIPYTEAVAFMKKAIEKSYGKKGAAVLDMNYGAVDSVTKNIVEVKTPADWAKATTAHTCAGCGACAKGAAIKKATPITNNPFMKNEDEREEYYANFCHKINSMNGESLPVSAFSPDGRVPTATTQFEKRNLATALPKWVSKNCIQCNFCSLVCPHATIRPHLLDEKQKKAAPATFETLKATGFEGKNYRMQINPHDCTGCGACANVCPAKEKALVMEDFSQIDEHANYEYSLDLPHPTVTGQSATPTFELATLNVKNSQFLKPYFEFSGACAGCGETPYIKLVTQLFGHKMIVANATGCSSIYGGSSPTCPYTVDEKGRGPAWANSLFEDNAEFGYGIKLANEIRGKSDSVWIFGGDGWADDIGYGGLDHIVAQNLDVNILVLDTQVYSNTGGQSSKSTPAGAIAKFASGGKATQSKDLGAMIMNYENVYVAQIALGANYAQALTAIKEAEAHKGPSVIIAYSTCINHGIDMSNGMKTMKNAVESGYWMLYRRTPATKTKAAELIIDSKEPTGSYQDFIKGETRFKALERVNPETAKVLFESGEQNSKRRYEKYKKLTGK